MIPIRGLRNIVPIRPAGSDADLEAINRDLWRGQKPQVQPLPEPPTDNPFIGAYSTGRRLVNTVAHDLGVTPEAVLGHGRGMVLVDARAVVAVLLRQRGKSYPEIARVIGRSDHSTPINLVSKFGHYCRRNDRVGASYARHLALIEEANAIQSEAA